MFPDTRRDCYHLGVLKSVTVRSGQSHPHTYLPISLQGLAMSRTIELAIDALLARKETLTVPNVMSAYLQVADFYGTDVYLDDAIAAFEHALDKHPLPLDAAQYAAYQRPYVLEVDQLRRDYLETRKKDERCTCGKCGRPIENPSEDSRVATEEETVPKPPARSERRMHAVFIPLLTADSAVHAGRTKKRRVTRRRASNSSDGSIVTDPFAPSTSSTMFL